MSYTADLSDSFFDAWVGAFRALDIDPLLPARIAISESNMKSAAICYERGSAFAGGLIQLVGSTLKGLGWTQGVAAFAALSAEDQVPTIARFYTPAKGRIKDQVSCYVWNWLPSLLNHAWNPTFVYASKSGPNGWTSETKGQLFYSQNAGLDTDHDGSITGIDLARRLDAANKTPRAQEVADRITAAIARIGTPGPRSSTPPPDDEPPRDYAA